MNYSAASVVAASEAASVVASSEAASVASSVSTVVSASEAASVAYVTAVVAASVAASVSFLLLPHSTITTPANATTAVNANNFFFMIISSSLSVLFFNTEAILPLFSENSIPCSIIIYEFFMKIDFSHFLLHTKG